MSKGEVCVEVRYKNSEEEYINLQLAMIKSSRKNLVKETFLRGFVIGLFAILCYIKYKIDIDLYGYLTEAASPVILVYITCGVLWTILLPILYWKVKSIVIVKEIENRRFDYQGEVIYKLEEDNIIVETFDNFYKVEWDKVIKSKFNKRILSITISGEQDLILPVNVFEDKDKLDEFNKYINEKVKLNSKIEEKQEG